MTLRDMGASFVRTVVPAMVGLILAGLAKLGIDADLSVAVSALVDAVFVGGYYALVRLLEARWPFFGVLLGWKAQPSYPPASPPEG